VKYDFDVAKKICPIKSGVIYNDNFQQVYKQNAFLEVLQECSDTIGRKKKTYQCLYTLDGTVITDLDKIPLNCKLLLVSETLPQAEEQEDGLEKAFVTGIDPKFTKKSNIDDMLIHSLNI
jgi:hypothetical protein